MQSNQVLAIKQELSGYIALAQEYFEAAER